ncbi:MAG: hypothetical protein WC617_19220 [Rhodanobacter sp.]|jgi:hypothetical protein
MNLRAYQGDTTKKQALLARLRVLAEQESLATRPLFWDGTGGSIVCSALHGDELDRWESELGLPKWLALCVDGIANWMLDPRAGLAAGIGLLEAVPVGEDVSLVGNHFLIHLLDDPTDGLSSVCSHAEQVQLIKRIVSLHRRCAEGGKVTRTDWVDVRKAATALRDQAAPDSVDDAVNGAIEAATWDPLISRTAVSDTEYQWVLAMSEAAYRNSQSKKDDPVRLVLGQLYAKAKAEGCEKPIDVLALLAQQRPDLSKVVKASTAFIREQPGIAWRRLEQLLLQQLRGRSWN